MLNVEFRFLEGRMSIMSKDITSKETAYDSTLTNKSNALKSLVKFLQKRYSAVSEVFGDGSDYKLRLYLQDSFMKDVFNFYPEQLCIDVNYFSFEKDIFSYTFVSEDSNGRNYVTAVAFLEEANSVALSWLFNVFKEHNPNWRKIKFLTVDPEINFGLEQCFPHSIIVISFYHAMRSFLKKLNSFSNLSEEQRNFSIESFKNMYFAHNQSEFQVCYQMFMTLPDYLVLYFHEYWMSKIHTWRTPLDYSYENIFKNLNSFLEWLNNSLKSLAEAENSSITFIQKLFLILDMSRKEKPTNFLHPISLLYSRFSSQYQISKVFTPYAAKFVIQQLNLSNDINVDSSSWSDSYSFDFLGISVNATAYSCTCSFYMFTLLPCRHIFAVRRILSINIFDESIVHYTWSVQYYNNCLSYLHAHFQNDLSSHIPQDLASRSAFASHLFEISLPSLMQVPEDIFESRCSLLQKLVSVWTNGDNISLQFSGIDKIDKKDYLCVSTPIIERLEPLSSTIEIPDSEQLLQIGNPSTSEEHPRRADNFENSILNESPINLAYICLVICTTKESCVEWLRHYEILPCSMMCPRCNSEMITKVSPRLSDGLIWWCTNIGANKKSCSKRCSIRSGSWFEMTNITLEQILIFCYMWINSFGHNRILAEVKISPSSYATCDKFCKRVCQESILNKPSQSDQVESSVVNLLEAWLSQNKEEDMFMKFLMDATAFYNKETLKSSRAIHSE